MEEKVTLGRIEKRHYLGYLIALYVVVASLLIWLVFSGTTNPFTQLSEVDKATIDRAAYFETVQLKAAKEYDSTMTLIRAYYGSAKTLENERQIEQRIAYIRGLYNNPDIQDSRKLVFMQMADFLNYSLSNAQNISVELDNIVKYKDDLERCRTGQ
ncbi:type VI secretion system TssO [Taibaiella chishuiensis]|uniref:Uncharacterized protein n=1 Tax=Taibaiella chishuiensis TaxID=1434707 RepID=A0A2P8D809_9BACT|nr:type VI secretion system TssO [Taibaiella chishuiensis]PSK93338.1 hypothetical protein B0I18_102308 [Taibaiella chishuiensis]